MAKMGRPKKDIVLDKKVTIRLSQEEFTVVLEYANKNNSNVAQVIRECLKDKLNNLE